ncbi:hypothetical protein BSLG_010834 [Batrachochytrium salamandrivorans]|nr:hypothetical protein BSLG_010834 [Batrachochytrium salamandrivorans]
MTFDNDEEVVDLGSSTDEKVGDLMTFDNDEEVADLGSSNDEEPWPRPLLLRRPRLIISINVPLPRSTLRPLSSHSISPSSVYENNPYSGAASFSPSEKDDVKTATDYISNKLNLGADDFKVYNSFTDPSGVTHVYGAHMTNGFRISNHHASAHVKNGQVTSFSSSFGTAQHFAKSDLAVSAPKAALDFAKASDTASAQLGIPVYSEFKHALEYVEQPDGKIVIQAVDLANKASYKAIPVPSRDATEGFSMVADPEFKGSSPNGWTAGKATGGNNVVTSNLSGKTTPSTKNGVFDTKFNGDDEPSTTGNIAASAVNLFYASNLMHDITYQYGFTEKAGNFQKDNFGKGGEENDAVVVNVLNTSKVNNANFFVGADGQPGEMNMFRFTYTTPGRSGGFDNGVVIHEYGHGVSVRLTGGSAMANALAQTSRRGEPEGIRSRPYTTDMKVNPWTYGDLKALDEVHDVGEVWASMLWEVYWGLVTKHGFSANLYDASQSAGNIVAMKIIMGGLMTQPCNPTFLSARDAIVAADASYYKGANKCEILKAFAKRGLGSKATKSRKNDFSVPTECDGDAPSPDPTATDTEETTTTTKRSRTTTKKTKTTATEEATTTTKRSRTTTKRSRTTSRAPEPTDEPDDDPTDESDDDPTYEPDEFAKM